MRMATGILFVLVRQLRHIFQSRAPSAVVADLNHSGAVTDWSMTDRCLACDGREREYTGEHNCNIEFLPLPELTPAGQASARDHPDRLSSRG